VAKVGTEAEEVESGRPKGTACPWQPSGTKASLTELDSEIDTPDPGGMPQLFKGTPRTERRPPRGTAQADAPMYSHAGDRPKTRRGR
jgi:hypothetical protein